MTGIRTLRTKISQPVPRHREIKEYLAKGLFEKDPFQVLN